MSNFFEEMHKKGIVNMELSIQEIQQLFIDGKITQDQFTKILIDNLGHDKFMKVMGEILNEMYDMKDLLSKPLPDNLNMFMRKPE